MNFFQKRIVAKLDKAIELSEKGIKESSLSAKEKDDNAKKLHELIKLRDKFDSGEISVPTLKNVVLLSSLAIIVLLSLFYLIIRVIKFYLKRSKK